MKIDKDEIMKIAKLSRLNLSEAETADMMRHFDGLLTQMKVLDDFDASAVEPTYNILGKVNVLRDDIAVECTDRELLLKSAPERNDEAYTVPRVVE